MYKEMCQMPMYTTMQKFTFMWSTEYRDASFFILCRKDTSELLPVHMLSVLQSLAWNDDRGTQAEREVIWKWTTKSDGKAKC